MGFPTLSGGLTKTEANAVLSRSFSQKVDEVFAPKQGNQPE
ncbi:MAG: hypothetical protein VKJ27_12065 [Synechocystis sp.]|nr:hypothetical protein [Synechocystis sp.]